MQSDLRKAINSEVLHQLKWEGRELEKINGAIIFAYEAIKAYLDGPNKTVKLFYDDVRVVKEENPATKLYSIYLERGGSSSHSPSRVRIQKVRGSFMDIEIPYLEDEINSLEEKLYFDIADLVYNARDFYSVDEEEDDDNAADSIDEYLFREFLSDMDIEDAVIDSIDLFDWKFQILSDYGDFIEWDNGNMAYIWHNIEENFKDDRPPMDPTYTHLPSSFITFYDIFDMDVGISAINSKKVDYFKWEGYNLNFFLRTREDIEPFLNPNANIFFNITLNITPFDFDRLLKHINNKISDALSIIDGHTGQSEMYEDKKAIPFINHLNYQNKMKHFKIKIKINRYGRGAYDFHY